MAFFSQCSKMLRVSGVKLTQALELGISGRLLSEPTAVLMSSKTSNEKRHVENVSLLRIEKMWSIRKEDLRWDLRAALREEEVLLLQQVRYYMKGRLEGLPWHRQPVPPANRECL